MDTQKFKRLPYGSSNFEKIITENYAYVDKTRFIEQLEKETNPYQFFIRPRKFGKSLFYSLLSHYYDANRADSFERLFGELYIGQHPTPKRSSYLIMQFNFSGIDTSKEEGFMVSFNRNIQLSVVMFIRYYRNFFKNADTLVQQIYDGNQGISAVQIACNEAALAGKKIFVLIDEYDHFANDLIAMGKYSGSEFYRAVVRANGVVRDFYETLKISTSGALGRIFITGISPVMLNDLTSGFNIANNLTLEPAYNEMMGFTQEEVNDLMVKTGVDTALVRVDMEMYYNGYLFNRNGGNKVYNPSMILYFFDQLLRNGASEDIIDSNMKTDYGRLQQLVQNGMNRQRLLEI
ncbi:MAG: AAA family ATPase, partial [Prevotellaceae bacterium]|nr:AAA family ATPase [Prevotellaceae bacterium]